MPNAVSRFPPNLPLATICGAILGVVPLHAAQAATLPVTDCTDGAGPGTLRHTIAGAADNSTIQIPLACSTITLANQIPIPATVTNMTIMGQGALATTIDAGNKDRAFFSSLTGTLTFEDLTIANSNYLGQDFPWGGCIYAAGSIDLENVLLTDCKLTPQGGGVAARGGAVFSRGSITLVGSTVTGNIVTGAPGQAGVGGGLYAANGILSEYSTISHNTAAGTTSRGGGIYSATHSAVIENSTISENRAYFNAALQVSAESAVVSGPYRLIVLSSTITGNVASGFQAIGSYLPVFVYNSTIAFNRAAKSTISSPVGLYSNMQISMYNSIFASNIAQTGSATDVFSYAAPNPLVGSHNLITATNNGVPLGTLNACPRLGHLSDNGGPTKTIPLLVNSPALDVGAANGQSTDQRGTGFPRTLGAGTDIGAYERQPGAIDDVIFFADFESRCD